MHGHNYVAEVTVEPEDAEKLDNLDRVVDFAVVKRLVGTWIDEHWDHAFLYCEDDREVDKAMKCIPGQRSYAMPCNPTAEAMARLLLWKAHDLLKHEGVVVACVQLWETSNCYAVAAREL
jgi:6-pyruvoyltetrahydropterin/6-carboxytetrahydropterin synthase